MSGPGTRRQYPCRTCGAAIYSDGTYWRAVRDDTTHCASDSIGHLPDAARAAAPPVEPPNRLDDPTAEQLAENDARSWGRWRRGGWHNLSCWEAWVSNPETAECSCA